MNIAPFICDVVAAEPANGQTGKRTQMPCTVIVLIKFSTAKSEEQKRCVRVYANGPCVVGVRTCVLLLAHDCGWRMARRLLTESDPDADSTIYYFN